MEYVRIAINTRKGREPGNLLVEAHPEGNAQMAFAFPES